MADEEVTKPTTQIPVWLDPETGEVFAEDGELLARVPNPKTVLPDLNAQVQDWRKQMALTVQEVKDAWIATHVNRDAITEAVEATLRKHLDTIVAQCIGFDERWGKWEVNHTNGREPAISVALSADIEAVAKRLVQDYAKDFRPTKVMVEAMRNEYKRHMEYALREAAKRQAEADVATVARDLGLL